MFGIPAAKLKEDGEKLNEDGEKMRVLGLPLPDASPWVEPSQLPPAENPLTLSASVKEMDGAGGELFQGSTSGAGKLSVLDSMSFLGLPVKISSLANERTNSTLPLLPITVILVLMILIPLGREKKSLLAKFCN